MKVSICLKCRRRTESKNIVQKMSKNKRPYILSTCAVCGRTKSVFVPIKSGADVQQWISQRFPETEFHLPVWDYEKGKISKAAFSGPNTQYYLRTHDN